MVKLSLRALPLLAALAVAQPAGAAGQDQSVAPAAPSEPLDAATLNHLKALYKQLIDAENCHDIAAVRPFVWNSPSTLFVAKTATAEEGNWAGFWGKDVVLQHFEDLYQGSFHMAPDYSKRRERADFRNPSLNRHRPRRRNLFHWVPRRQFSPQ